MSTFPTARPMCIAVDVDEVSLHLMPEWLARYAARSGHALAPSDITGWNVIPHLSGAWVTPFFAILEGDDLYDGVPALAGAAAGLADLRATGAHIAFVTAGALGSLASKRRRMRTLGLLTSSDGFVVAMDKTRAVRADAYVDDRAETILAALAMGRIGVLMVQPWNAWAVDDVRAAGGIVANDWATVVGALRPVAVRRARAHPPAVATYNARRRAPIGQ